MSGTWHFERYEQYQICTVIEIQVPAVQKQNPETWLRLADSLVALLEPNHKQRLLGVGHVGHSRSRPAISEGATYMPRCTPHLSSHGEFRPNF